MCPCSILWAESGLVLSCPSLWKHYRFINNWSFTNQIGKLPKTPDARLCLGFSVWLFGDKIFILDRINCRLYASEYRYIDTFCISLRKKNYYLIVCGLCWIKWLKNCYDTFCNPEYPCYRPANQKCREWTRCPSG